MNEELKANLESIYQYALEAQEADREEAANAMKEGQMATYFDLSLCLQLADTCWALEKWEEADKWYKHNAKIFEERRKWYTENNKNRSSLDELLDWEATTLVKAGMLDAGKERLKEAINFFKRREGKEIVLTVLGLHAAQAGIKELLVDTATVIAIREELPGINDPVAVKARKQLHYELAEAALLSGNTKAFTGEAAKLYDAATPVKLKPGTAYPVPVQDALIAAAEGMQILASLLSGDADQAAADKAKQSFEKAMLDFFRFSDLVDHDLYFMRLNTLLVDQVMSGKTIDPNPFSVKG